MSTTDNGLPMFAVKLPAKCSTLNKTVVAHNQEHRVIGLERKAGHTSELAPSALSTVFKNRMLILVFQVRIIVSQVYFVLRYLYIGISPVFVTNHWFRNRG